MSKELQTTNMLIQINNVDEKNIVKGLGMLIELYADSLKEISYNTKIHGSILECELVGINDCVERLQLTTKTLELFCKKF